MTDTALMKEMLEALKAVDDTAVLALTGKTYKEYTIPGNVLERVSSLIAKAEPVISALSREGMVLVPREPTEAQRVAFNSQPGNWFDKMRAAYRAASQTQEGV